ncbi:MAG TPA: NAD(P)/FAD-dependent oxidoreductase [Ferruginibacter sp.]|nr:NAD(P)/FAD-dependent oxidoreductase [Ferruginibacter sp.]HRN78950.1 NAD(P)/FAD-dependent oxidoreductase [Ferruginibacter sp.]HRO17218.1 NAD(P)/FAD-dependent oxidoreductase [Ferruginibacter sp.]HRQ20400.1 NAD(P)/FAD-dependent oxidoreductase [Ferruginibacter sp.]
MKKLVIIGGGFAGVNLARALRKTPDVDITLVDKNNYNFFPPLLYQVATGFLEPSNISYPFRKLFTHQKNIRFRMGTLERIDANNNRVILSNGELDYDYLVLATGTVSNDFGMASIRKNALHMKTIDDAIEIRNTMLQRIEEATLIPDPEARNPYKTIVIAGGGPTGVEIAGMLAEMRKNVFHKDYPEFKGTAIRICLIDAAPVLLTPMSQKAQHYTRETLTKMGVEVMLNVQVKDYNNDKVMLSDGTVIETKILVWAAGVTSSIFNGIPESSIDRGRRMRVNPFQLVDGTTNIFAIGDTCLMLSDPKFPNGHPQVAQVALQQGKNLAHNLKAFFKNQPMKKPFRYYDKGSMAIIGRMKATADIPKPKWNMTGFAAWMMWLFIHLFFLISYRNRVLTMYNWTVSYFTKDQALRMIIRPKESPE